MFDSTDPFRLLAEWLDAAGPTEPRVPEAMQIATAGADGRPSVRTVLLKDHGPAGLVFYTNLGSRKARQIDENPWVGFVLHFKGLERQVLGEGPVKLVEPAVADAYHASRGRGSQLGAWASQQSAALESEQALRDAVDAATKRFEGQDVPRPPFWSGYRIEPIRLEFWQGRPDRLHDRCVFEQADGEWTQTRLFP